MSELKYELTCETKQISVGLFQYITVYRIRALKDFGDVKKGDSGGYVEGTHNLSQDDNCWIYDDAICYDGARVMDNAKLSEKAKAFGEAVLKDSAVVKGRAMIFENAVIGGQMVLDGASRAYGKAVVK